MQSHGRIGKENNSGIDGIENDRRESVWLDRLTSPPSSSGAVNDNLNIANHKNPKKLAFVGVWWEGVGSM